MTAYTQDRREGQGELKGLAAYSAARPPHSEGLAVFIAVLPRERDRAAQHQPAAPSARARRVQAALHDGRGVSAHRLPARGDDRPPDARHRSRARACSPRSIRRSARARTSSSCGRRCSKARSTGSSSDHACCRHEMKVAKNALRQHLDGQVGLRRHRVSAAGAGVSEGSEARDELQPHGRAHELRTPRGASALNARATSRRGLRRRPRARRPARDLDHPRRGFANRRRATRRSRASSSRRASKATFLRGELVCENGKVARQAARPVPAPPDRLGGMRQRQDRGEPAFGPVL